METLLFNLKILGNSFALYKKECLYACIGKLIDDVPIFYFAFVLANAVVFMKTRSQ